MDNPNVATNSEGVKVLTRSGLGREYQCPACSLVSHKRNLRRHIQRKHNGDSEIRKHVFTSAVACLDCQDMFSTVKSLKPHLKTQHGMVFDEKKIIFTNINGKLH